MNGLRKLTDKIKPAFEKGGKLGFLHSTFDAFETFLFVPDTVTKRGAHVRDRPMSGTASISRESSL